MNAQTGGRVRARSRADRRLRAMTIGTAMLGVAATGALGWAAAITFDGKTSTALAAGPDSGDGSTGVDPNAGFPDPNAGLPGPNSGGIAPNPGVNNPNTGVSNPNSVSGSQGTVPTVRHSRRSSGHASTGGS